MTSSEVSTTTVTLFVRHSPDCTQKANPQWKRCGCRKYLYIYEGGKVRYMSCKTRSWEQAERIARVERDGRDPIKLELAKIVASKAEQDCSLSDALDQWIAGIKGNEPATDASYQTFKNTMLKWADSVGIRSIGEVTPDVLDAWVSSWEGSLNTQGFRLTRLRTFFRWATGIHKINQNPALMLRTIRRENDKETQPLTAEQFEALLAATYKYDEDRRVDKDRFGADLRAVFLVQRWTGLRISDVLMLPRSAVKAGRIAIITKKGGVPIDRPVPDAVIAALNAVPVRKTMWSARPFMYQFR